MRNTFWLQKIGPEYIELAFRWAHEADPQALLFYNDYNNEGLNPKSDAIYRLVQDLRSRGVPIHGVGLQMHLRVDLPPDTQAVAANMERLAQLGLQVHITEIDVRIQNGSGSTEERLRAQAQIYRDMLSVCLNATNCPAFVTWGVSDQYSWIPGFTGNPDAPLLFDASFQPKPAYNALVELLSPQAQNPTGPAIRVDIQPASSGGQVQVLFQLFNVAEVYGLEANCSANPAVLSGADRIDGEGFNSSNSFFVDQGYNATNGSWVVAATRLMPNPAISGSMTAFGLNYTAQNAGDTTVNCSVLAVDKNGYPLPLEVIQNPSAPPQPTAQQPASPLPTATPPQTSVLNGTVTYQNGPDNAGITVRLLANDSILAEAETAADGTYRFPDVPPGAYTLEAHAPYHLPIRLPITVTADGAAIELASAMLPSGDTDNSGMIDIVDAIFIGANFGIQTPPAPANADLNRDALVNVSDLVLVGANFGLSGPVMVSSEDTGTG